MNTRLQQFLSAENITQAQFANTIGVAKASISHIISGRNKPGYDVLINIMASYPELNIEWLMNGNGKMYKNMTPVKIDKEENALQDDPVSLFDTVAKTSTLSKERYSNNQLSYSPKVSLQNSNTLQESHIHDHTSVMPLKKDSQDSTKKIKKIIIFFEDNTFIEY